MRNRLLSRLCIVAMAFGFAGAGASHPAGEPASAPASDLDYWLGRAQPATTTAAAAQGRNPFAAVDHFRRPDALPGVVVLSDGRMLAGGIFTTRDKDWETWLEAEKRWRHIPPLAVLSIRAVVVEEEMEKEWRWKEMGSDEKFYTGRVKPTRRLAWRFHLIDDSYVTGSVKGQPLWVQLNGTRRGPFVLHERSAGEYGQGLKDLVHVRSVVVSRRAMEEVLKRQKNPTRPAR